jgi:hypothetical protein
MNKVYKVDFIVNEQNQTRYILHESRDLSVVYQKFLSTLPEDRKQYYGVKKIEYLGVAY